MILTWLIYRDFTVCYEFYLKNENIVCSVIYIYIYIYIFIYLFIYFVKVTHGYILFRLGESIFGIISNATVLVLIVLRK